MKQDDGLALEYQGNYGTARGDLDVAYLVNNPAANGICSVPGLSFSEEGKHLLVGEVGPLLDDGAHSLFVGVDTP